MAARKTPTTVDLWIVTNPEGVAIERRHTNTGTPLAWSNQTTLANAYRYPESFPCGAVLPADVPTDKIRHLAASGYIQRVNVPLPKEQ